MQKKRKNVPNQGDKVTLNNNKPEGKLDKLANLIFALLRQKNKKEAHNTVPK